MALLRVIKANEGRSGWQVLDEPGGQALAHTRTKSDALAFAKQHLGRAAEGGKLLVHYADGRIEHERFVPSDTAVSPLAQKDPGAEGLLGTARTVSGEGKRLDKGLDAVDYVVGLLALLGAPVSAWINPEVQEAAGDGWIALTLATFTWTVGCALGIVVLRRSGLAGWPQVTAVSACYVVAFAISGVIGREALELQPVTGYGGFSLIATFMQAALAAYGLGGLLLSTALGSWLGFRMSPHFNKNFLV